QQQQQPQTIVVQDSQPQKKQGFMSKHPLMAGLAAGAVGAYAINEFQEHQEEKREEAFEEGRNEGYTEGYGEGLDDAGDYDF
ncbi:hypothetical protein GGF37_005507, partial [Kickxella alabastrina]